MKTRELKCKWHHNYLKMTYMNDKNLLKNLELLNWKDDIN